jgi:hypothetical protein|nr:MAG TPA: hypothetical protein [Caudoviricetes sp.]
MEIKRYKFLIGNVNTDIIDITHNSDLIGNQRKEI